MTMRMKRRKGFFGLLYLIVVAIIMQKIRSKFRFINKIFKVTNQRTEAMILMVRDHLTPVAATEEAEEK